MRFTDEVVSFKFADIPIVGCLHTSAVIGLTEAGSTVCERLHHEDVPEEDIALVDANLLEHLKSGGFFGDIPTNEHVLSSYLHVTQRCNLNCAGCYSLDKDRNTLKDAPLKNIQRALDGLTEEGVKHVVISGGEPFLRDDLPSIVKYAKKNCALSKVTVLSNGLCFTEQTLSRLAPYVDCVSVSFDGCSANAPAYIRQNQRFDELVAAVQAVRKAGIPAHILPTVHAKNIANLADYVALSKELGATLNFSLLTCEPNDKTLGGLLPQDKELQALGLSLLTLNDGQPAAAMDTPASTSLTVKRNCGAGHKTLSVAADGTIYPCHMLHRREMAMGNAFTGSVSDALKSDVSSIFRHLDASQFEECESCRHLYICGGGCRARSLYKTGSLTAKDSYCTMTTTFYDALGEVMATSLGKSS